MSQTSRKMLLFGGKLTVVIPTITLSPSSLPGATAETAYNQTVSASGGTAPYVYTVSAGVLPNGLTLHSGTGVIDGTPTTVQNPSFTITATDAFSFTGNKSYSINVVAPTITVPSSPPAGTVASAYSYSFAASGGVGPYTYAVTAGSLPSSLSLNAGTGLLSGTPTRVATSTFTVTATDNGGFTGTSGSVSVGVTISYLLDDEFTTNASAPMPTPRTCEPGPGTLTLTDTTNKLSIVSSALHIAGINAERDPWVREVVGHSRAAGLLLKYSIKTNPAVQAVYSGFANTLTNPINTNHYGTAFNSSGNLNPLPEQITISGGSAGVSFDVIDTVLQATGYYLFLNDNLVWVGVTGSEATLFPAISERAAGTVADFDYFRLRQLAGSRWTTQNGLATLNVASPVTATGYTGSADQIIDMTLHAGASILTVGGYRFRVQDATNYWEAYFDTSLNFKLDSVVAGTPTNRITVAGVIATSGTRTIRCLMRGSLIDVYTLNGSTWTKQGAQINLSTFSTQTGITTDFGADWTVTNLLSYPYSSANYPELGDV